MAKERICVIGGLGYLGSVVAREALKKDWDVCIYDSVVYEQNSERMLKEIGDAKLIIGDTRNTDLLRKSLKEFNPTWVFHFGELSSVYACNHNPVYTREINHLASMNVLDICKELNLKVIYNSSSSVYGTQKENRLMKEYDELPEATDYYTHYKILMEEYIKNKNFLNVIVFRPATVFGLSPRFRIELLPNHFTYMAVSRKNIPISGLNAYRAAIDIDELVEGYFKVIEKETWIYRVYNIGSHNKSKKDFALGIQEVVNCEITHAPDMGDLRNLQIDCSRFNEEFNFQPEIQYWESIEKIRDYLKENLAEIESNNFREMLNMPLDKWRQICIGN